MPCDSQEGHIVKITNQLRLRSHFLTRLYLHFAHAALYICNRNNITIMLTNFYMKHTLNRRQHDFLLTCRQILRASSSYIKPCDLARKALASQAREYYINEDYAYRMVLGFMKYGKMPTRQSTRAMCLELVGRVTALKAVKPGLCIMPAVKTVLESGTASRFFISHRTAQNLIERNYRLLLK